MIVQVMLRAPDQATMEAGLLKYGLMVQTEDGPASIRGLCVSPEIPIWTTPPTYDEEGNQTDAGTRDTRYHCNVIAGPPATTRRGEDGELTFNRLLELWAAAGEPGVPNKAEVGFVYDGVEIIAMPTVSSPSHRFLS